MTELAVLFFCKQEVWQFFTVTSQVGGGGGTGYIREILTLIFANSCLCCSWVTRRTPRRRPDTVSLCVKGSLRTCTSVKSVKIERNATVVCLTVNILLQNQAGLFHYANKSGQSLGQPVELSCCLMAGFPACLSVVSAVCSAGVGVPAGFWCLCPTIDPPTPHTHPGDLRPLKKPLKNRWFERFLFSCFKSQKADHT